MGYPAVTQAFPKQLLFEQAYPF